MNTALARAAVGQYGDRPGAQVKPGWDRRGQLLASECPDPGRCLGDARRVWVIRLGTMDDPLTGLGEAKEDLLRQQYQLSRIWYPAGLTIAVLQRSAS